MPTYDYHCDTCGIDFEIAQAFSDDTLTRCPTKKAGQSPAGCVSSGRGKVTKVFSAPGITFKGDGFYKNDSRNGSKSKSTTTPSETSSSSSSSDSSSSDKSTSSTSSAAPASTTSESKADKKSSSTSAKTQSD